MNEMWDQMSAELRAENQDIFIAYHDRIARKEFDSDEMEPQFGNAERKMVALPPSLRHCFDDAIMNKAPSDVYVAVPSALTRLRIALLTFVPTGWREYFIQRKYKHNIASILKVWTTLRCQLKKLLSKESFITAQIDENSPCNKHKTNCFLYIFCYVNAAIDCTAL